MKAIAMGLAVGVLAVLGFVQLASKANAVTCPGENCGNGYAYVHGFPLPPHFKVKTAIDRTFITYGFLSWCEDGSSYPYVGALVIDETSSEMEKFDWLDPEPDYFNPADCVGTVGVSCSGELSGDYDEGLVRVRGFVYAPYEFDEESFIVEEY